VGTILVIAAEAGTVQAIVVEVGTILVIAVEAGTVQAKSDTVEVVVGIDLELANLWVVARRVVKLEVIAVVDSLAIVEDNPTEPTVVDNLTSVVEKEHHNLGAVGSPKEELVRKVVAVEAFHMARLAVRSREVVLSHTAVEVEAYRIPVLAAYRSLELAAFHIQVQAPVDRTYPSNRPC